MAGANGPTILSVEPDSAWVVIVVVSFVTFVTALGLRKLIGRPGGLASGLFLSLPLVLPLLAALAYAGTALPEVGVLQPARRALRDGSGELLHLLFLADSSSGAVTPYALNGSAGSWILVVGLAVSSFMLIRRAVGAIAVRRLVARCSPLPDGAREKLERSVVRLSAAAGLKTTPDVLMLPEGRPGAFAVGSRRRRILLSSDLLEKLDGAEIDAILAHEVAHLEARDCQVTLVAGFLRDLVAWNPVAHLSSHRLVTDRELEADRRAASLTGKPLAVASSLVKVCELVRNSRFHHRALVAFLRPGSRINRRVTNLLALADGPAVVAPPRHMPYAFAAVLLAVVGLQAGARIAAEDATALAIMWGNSGGHQDAKDFRALYKELKRPPAAKGVDSVKPRHYARLANLSVLPRGAVDSWVKAMSKLATSQKRAFVRLRWESRQNWRAIPLFSETVGPFDLYTIQRQPL